MMQYLATYMLQALVTQTSLIDRHHRTIKTNITTVSMLEGMGKYKVDGL